MLGPVVLEDALEVGHPRDQPEVEQEDPDADRLLDEDEDDRGVERALEQACDPDGNQEEQADREHDRQDHGPEPGAAADLLVVLLRLGVGGDAEGREADLERLGEGDHTAHDRQPEQPVPADPRHERL